MSVQHAKKSFDQTKVMTFKWYEKESSGWKKGIMSVLKLTRLQARPCKTTDKTITNSLNTNEAIY